MIESESLLELEKLLSLVAAPMLVCEAVQQKFIFCNESAQELTGYDGQSIQGLAATELFASQNHALIKAIFDLSLKNKKQLKIQESDLRIRRRAGRLCDVNLSAMATEIEGQVYLVITMQDLGEIRRQENEREKLMEETARISKLADIGRLAAGMAHELNNPLAILMGYVENLMGNIQGSQTSQEKILEDLIPIEKAAQRMSKVIAHMLSKMRNEPQMMKAAPLKRAVEGALSLLEGILSSQSIHLEIDIDDSWVQCDETSVEQIITNIITNACNALESQKDRSLRLRTKTEKGQVKLEIWNNGLPIPEEVQVKLFTPFFTTKATGEGTGLGLYMSYQIMKAHQGELSFQSDAQKGTSFWLSFPKINKPSITVSPAGLRALVVDDDIFFRKLMCKKLGKFGVQCVEARDGQEAFHLIKSQPSFDMVLVDFKMPRMDGLQLLKIMKDNKIEIPVILISGALSVAELEAQTLKYALFACISKPVETSELEGIVEKIAVQSRSHRPKTKKSI